MEQPPAYSRPAPPSLEKSLPHQSPFAIPVPADTASHHRSTNRHPHPHGPQLPIPDPTASSAVVSAYIHSTLICNAEAYDIDPEEISRLSRVWKHGTGQELREYDQATFRELYGIPLGTMLHKQVLSDRQNPKDILLLLLLPALLTPFGASLIYARKTIDEDDESAEGVMLGLGISVILLSTVVGVLAIAHWWKCSRKLVRKKKEADDFYGSGGEMGVELPLMSGHDEDAEELGDV